jgi:CRP-like cAMP-binding protein
MERILKGNPIRRNVKEDPVPNAGMIRQEVETRIAELEALLEPLRAEHAQLKAVAATFGAGAGSGGRRRTPRAATATPVGRGAGGSRAQQAVALITAQPGVTAADLAQALGISRNYLYRVLPRLEARGVVTKEGMGYHPAAPPVTSVG